MNVESRASSDVPASAVRLSLPTLRAPRPCGYSPRGGGLVADSWWWARGPESESRWSRWALVAPVAGSWWWARGRLQSRGSWPTLAGHGWARGGGHSGSWSRPGGGLVADSSPGWWARGGGLAAGSSLESRICQLSEPGLLGLTRRLESRRDRLESRVLICARAAGLESQSAGPSRAFIDFQ